MVDEPEFAENALQQLLVIYQKTKEWKKAVNIAEKLAKISPKAVSYTHLTLPTKA